MGNAKQYATEIEHILCKVFDCKRFGFGGIVDSDFIRKNPFIAIASGLAFIYAEDSSKKCEIDLYLEKYSYYLKYDLDMLIRASDGKIEPNWDYDQEEYGSGEEIVKSIIADLEVITE